MADDCRCGDNCRRCDTCGQPNCECYCDYYFDDDDDFKKYNSDDGPSDY